MNLSAISLPGLIVNHSLYYLYFITYKEGCQEQKIRVT